jgi:DNA-binding GntR family transcriptional regulator
VNQNTAGPYWLAVANDLRSKISEGTYQVGDAIPSTQDLAKRHGVSPSTVRRAIDDLRSGGIVQGHVGDRVYVRAIPADIAGERADTAALAGQVGSLQETVARVEANLIELYAKTGHDYPQDAAQSLERRTPRRRAVGRGGRS